MGNVQKESGAKWGKRESATLPSRTRYVKYTENYKNRVVVDYDAGTILIEHLDEEKAKEKLRNAAVVALVDAGRSGCGRSVFGQGDRADRQTISAGAGGGSEWRW